MIFLDSVYVVKMWAKDDILNKYRWHDLFDTTDFEIAKERLEHYRKKTGEKVDLFVIIRSESKVDV